MAQQTFLWQQSMATSQQKMVEQTTKQKELLESQSKSMSLLAEDSQSMVEDLFMSKDYSQMDDRTKRYYEYKMNKFFEQYGIE
jgi:hypothetical protein